MTISKILNNIRNNEALVSLYQTGMTKVFDSTVLNFLREKSAVRIGLTNDLNLSAFEAHRSAGYNECLDDLMYFVDRYIRPMETADKTAPPMNFGARSRALERGDITEEERNALREHRPPNYPKPTAEPNPSPHAPGVRNSEGAKGRGQSA